MKSKLLIIISLASMMLLSYLLTATTLFSQSIRLDESQSLWESTKPIITILKLTGSDVHVPLYGILLHFWIQIFGTTIISARILSFIFFLVSIPVLYKLYEETSNKRVALLSVLAFSLSPFVLWYSSESRMYTLFILVASINNLYFLRYVKSGGKHAKLGYMISTIFGIYTHYFYLFSVLTQGIFLLGMAIVNYTRNKNVVGEGQDYNVKKALILFGKYILLTAIAFTSFIPWVLYVIHLGSASNTQPLIPKPTIFNIFQTFVYFIFGFQSDALQSIIISLWPLLVMVFFFLFTQKKRILSYKIDYFLVSALLPIAIVYMLSFIKPIFLSRYLIFTTPSLFFIIIWSFMGYHKKVMILLTSIFLVFLLSLLLLQNFSNLTPVKENYLGASTYLTSNATTSDIINVTAPFTI